MLMTVAWAMGRSWSLGWRCNHKSFECEALKVLSSIQGDRDIFQLIAKFACAVKLGFDFASLTWGDRLLGPIDRCATA